MSRIAQIAPESATGKSAELFSAVKGKLGMVPNMLRAFGNSPSALNAYLQFSGSLAGGVLAPTQRELIALAVEQANQCDYCLAAHTALGKMAGLSADQVRDARYGTSVDSDNNALLKFARKLVENRGHVSNEDIQDMRNHGFEDAHIAEVVANVALNIFTNYFNHVAEPEIDFPKAPSLELTSA